MASAPPSSARAASRAASSPAARSVSPASAARAPEDEIRFAVVINGGVSLAVWIGGTVLELDRVTRRDGPYDHIVGLVAGNARADVIAGTSAGGINGAALALAQVNSSAQLMSLRDIAVRFDRVRSDPDGLQGLRNRRRRLGPPVARPNLATTRNPGCNADWTPGSACEHVRDAYTKNGPRCAAISASTSSPSAAAKAPTNPLRGDYHGTHRIALTHGHVMASPNITLMGAT